MLLHCSSFLHKHSNNRCMFCMLIMLCHCLCLSMCVCALCVSSESVCVCTTCVVCAQFCLLCYALLSFSCFCVFNKRSGPALSHTHTRTHVHVDSPPCTPFPLLAITMTSRFYDFDICFRLLLCMQMTLALMVTQMIVGCCMVTVGAGRGVRCFRWV